MKKLLIIIIIACSTQSIHAQEWLEVSSGAYFSVAIHNDGTLWAWGENDKGQLGIGNTTNQTNPVMIGSDNDWEKISAGAKHCLALKSNGTLWAWGDNSQGQLGIGTKVDQSAPIQVGTSTYWVEIEAGPWYSLALRNIRTLWGWGDNSSYQMGNNNTDDVLEPMTIDQTTTFRDIAAGPGFCIGINTNGFLRGWGDNSFGVFGLSATATPHVKTPIQIGGSNIWRSVEAGFHSIYTIGTDGILRTWGANGDGQLGNGLVNDPIIGFGYSNWQVGFDTDWKMIKAGPLCAFAIKNDSTLWVTGNNNGQFGTGNYAGSFQFVQVGTESDWVDIAPGTAYLDDQTEAIIGGMHTAGIRASHNTICTTGANEFGQLGDGTTLSTNHFNCIASTIGIKEENTINDKVKIFPNPSNGQFQVDLTQLNGNASIANIYNAVGQLVKTTHFNDSNHQLSYNFTDQKDGLYLLEILTVNNERIIKKLQINQ